MATMLPTLFSIAFFLWKEAYFNEKFDVGLKPALDQKRDWRRTGDEPLSEKMVAWLTETHKWINS